MRLCHISYWVFLGSIPLFAMGCVQEDLSGESLLSASTSREAPRISYLQSESFTVNGQVRDISPRNTGGPISSCSVTPTLPSGLSIDPVTCSISGKPTSVSSRSDYLVRATNSAGSSTATLSLAIRNATPSISYSGSLLDLNLNKPMQYLSAVNNGGVIGSGGCSVLPALPLGLTLNSNDCSISGTPLVPLALSPFIVTATNALGSASTALGIRINDIAPILSYSISSILSTLNTVISPILATNTGGSIPTGGCSVSPALPTGLHLNVDTCAITGIPSLVSAASNYTVTATNSVGSSSAVLQVGVGNIAPILSYGSNLLTLIVGGLVSAIVPASTGGAIAPGTCSVNPSLPTGLVLNQDTCVISGVPLTAAVSAPTAYTVTASNFAGTATTTLNLGVNDVAPDISYADSPFTFTLNSLISPIAPANAGGAVALGGCSVTPSLPLGILLDPNTCTLGGLPLAISPLTTYTVQATNSAGSSSTTIALRVNNIAPSISYASSSLAFSVGSAISTVSPSNSGGAIQLAGCSVLPLLPLGLSFNVDTCAITGTPSPLAVSSATNYVVTAVNAAGSSTANLSITVNNAAPNISYSQSVLTLKVGNLLSLLVPTNSGGAINIGGCSISPALPLGLLFDTTTCSIIGTPLFSLTPKTYTVTATNAVGSGTTSLSLTVAP